MNAFRTPLFSALLLTATATCALAQPYGFEVGQPVPDLVLPAADDGAPRSLADYRGEKYILHVFASW